MPTIFAKASINDFGQLPRFSCREESTAVVTTRVLVMLVALLIPAVLIGGLGVRRLRRFSVV